MPRLAFLPRRLRGIPHSVLVIRILAPLFMGAFAIVWIGCDRGSGPQQSAAPGASVVKFNRISVHDDQMNNMEAFSVLVPEGWNEEAGVNWEPTLLELACLQLKVTDPQSGAELQFLPPQKYVYMPNPVMPLQEGANYMGSIVGAPITDLDQYVRTAYAPQVLPELQDASVTSRQELSNFAAAVQQAYGDPSQVKSEKIRYQCTRDGQPWEEDVYLTLVYTPTESVTLWEVYSASVFRAPKGQLDTVTPLLTSVSQSTRLNPDWFGGLMYVRDLFMKRNMDAIHDAGAISQTISQNSDEIRQEYSDSYKKAQDTNDKINQDFSETIRGVNTYSNPYEDRPVELPSGYNDAWVNANGQYILSNQSGYDPNVGGTTEWKRMDQRGENRQ